MMTFTTAEQASYIWTALDLSSRSTISSSDLPSGAVLAGAEHGKPTFVARVYHDGHWEIAKLNAWARFGYAFHGRELETEVGEVLVACDGQEPVWINSGFGERLDEAICMDVGYDFQFIARAWHRDRWIPGKLICKFGHVYFPFGGHEHTTRRYQLLCATLQWRRLSQQLQSPRLAEALVPVNDQLFGTPENSVQHISKAWQKDRPDHLKIDSHIFRLVQKTAQACQWVGSGEGERVRNAVAMHHYQIGRVATGDGPQYAYGFVHPFGSQFPGLHLRHHCADTYQVLTLDCNRQGGLCLPYRLVESAESSPDASDEIFLVTKLAPGESPGAVYQEMVTEAQACHGVSSLMKDTQAERVRNVEDAQTEYDSALDANVWPIIAYE